MDEFILIGGNAVIAHGVPRFTRDVDFVIPERLVAQWQQFLESEGFLFAHGTDALLQFEDPARNRPRVDLMIVAESTWANLISRAGMIELSSGVTTLLATAEHLIAMKLRAMLSPHRREDAQDWSDIVELTVRKNFDPRKNSEFANLVLKFGNEGLLQKLIHEISERTTK